MSPLSAKARRDEFESVHCSCASWPQPEGPERPRPGFIYQDPAVLCDAGWHRSQGPALVCSLVLKLMSCVGHTLTDLPTIIPSFLPSFIHSFDRSSLSTYYAKRCFSTEDTACVQNRQQSPLPFPFQRDRRYTNKMKSCQIVTGLGAWGSRCVV